MAPNQRNAAVKAVDSVVDETDRLLLAEVHGRVPGNGPAVLPQPRHGRTCRRHEGDVNGWKRNIDPNDLASIPQYRRYFNFDFLSLAGRMTAIG